MMHCAGMLEGYLAHEGIWNHFNAILDIKYPGEDHAPEGRYPSGVFEFMNSNHAFTRAQIESNPDSKYWQEIGLIYEQFVGIQEGYAAGDDGTHPMSYFDHWFFQSAGDMFDIAAFAKDDNDEPAPEFREHCSGMVKLTDDYSDIFFSHDAWSDYRELHGMLKEYNLPVPEFRARKVTMSTRVGKIGSYDDFYVSDSGLFVLETTLNNYNERLYDVVVPQCLFTWIRAMHAVWVAKDGSDWCTTFIKYNSGTYNNQYVVVDSNKFKRGEKPSKDLLWIIEQFPGTYRMTDVTFQLVRDGYFPSVNCPWHEDLYELAGYPELVASMGIYGAYRSNYESPRYQIMKREADRIKTFSDFKAFMRYNDWERDPFAQGDPAQQIASRYDLREASSPYGAINNFGDLDTKALRLTEAIYKLKIHAIASPPYENNKPWKFSEPNWPLKEVDRHGLPDEWKFNWTTFESMEKDECEGLKEKSCLNNRKCGWCTYNQKCWPGDKDEPFFERKCEAGWKVKQDLQSWAVPLIVTVCVLSVTFAGLVYGSHWYMLKKKEKSL